MHNDCSERVYSNSGNPAVVSLIDADAFDVLDIGCGAGDTASLLKRRDPDKRIFGITASREEATIAQRWMEDCRVGDIEGPLPPELAQRSYDVIVCSHVLEHLRDPAAAVERLCNLLKIGGALIVAVPNIAFWRQRWRLMAGHFEYESGGTMDETHLRFFTYYTADRYLLARAREMQLVERITVGSVPLWILRRKLLSKRLARSVDRMGTTLWPNLFGAEVLFKAIKVRI